MSDPLLPSEFEATHYYAGLPSSPRLLARSSCATPWEEPKEYRRLKQLKAVVNHKLNDIWEDNVALKVIACLDELEVKWTSIDIVRIGEVESSYFPVVLWIGVEPESLAGEDARNAAFMCLDILHQFDITDVEVELRESSVIRSAGPKLLPSALDAGRSKVTVDVRRPLTHALGLPISAQVTPSVGGTGGFFMAESRNNNNLLLITARHVVLPPNTSPNNNFERLNESHPRHNILLMGNNAYEHCIASIEDRISGQQTVLEHGHIRSKGVEGRDDELAIATRNTARREIEDAEVAMKELRTFLKDVKTNWGPVANRVLGHVVFSPPICFAAGTVEERYTEDFAVIAVDNDKIDRTNFHGNFLDLRNEIPSWEFVKKMYPNCKNSTTFKYPLDSLLKVQGTISDEELRNPTMVDQNNDSCMMVIKNGATTGVTIGRALHIKSYTRLPLYGNGNEVTSKEWAIISCDSKSGAFSEPGDSGAVIVDGLGRIGGLLTAGAARPPCTTAFGRDFYATSSSDITYATPINFLLKRIKSRYPDAHFNMT